MKKIFFGNALIDLARLSVFVYSSVTEEEIHRNFGGKCIYRSRSGKNGFGIITEELSLRDVGIYRVVNNAVIIPEELDKLPETLPGVKVLYPVGCDPKWPLVVFWRNESFLVYERDLFSLFTSKDFRDFPEEEIIIKYISNIFGDVAERTLPFRLFKGAKISSYHRRIAESLYKGILKFYWGRDAAEEASKTSRFWIRLGLWKFNRNFYKILHGICRARFSEEELSSLEKLRDVAPRNTFFLSPSLYIQGDAFEAVSLNEGGGTNERRLETAEIVKALTGDFAELAKSMSM